jgi:hypothetical protein
MQNNGLSISATGGGMARQKACLSITLLATAMLYGCESMFVDMHVSGQLPQPVFEMERELKVSEFHVEKIEPSENGGFKRIEYWWVVEKSHGEAQSFDSITYASVPDGYFERIASKPLDYGYYQATAETDVRSFSSGDFAVLKTADGGPIVVDMAPPETEEASLIRCIYNFRFIQKDVKSDCHIGIKEQ